MDLSKLSNVLLLHHAVLSDNLETAKYVLSQGIDPKESLPHDLRDQIVEHEEDDTPIYYPAIVKVQSVEMAKLLCPDKIDFKNLDGIDLIGDDEEITEYYLTKGLDPKLLDYHTCYSVSRFADLGVIHGLNICDVNDELSNEQILKVVKLGAKLDMSDVFIQEENIMREYLNRHLKSIKFRKDGYIWATFKNGESVLTHVESNETLKILREYE